MAATEWTEDAMSFRNPILGDAPNDEKIAFALYFYGYYEF